MCYLYGQDEISPPGKAAEILSTQHEVMQKYLDLGTVFVTVG
ncbi:hypothetical protein [Acinetobacter sp. SCLZS86]|nr:hypothetical protein [Acinetobacter sp. SCLZS86]